jgi:hypothetical protein
MPTVIKGSGDSTFGGTIQTTGIDDNATSNAITIDSSERVCVGGDAAGANSYGDGFVIRHTSQATSAGLSIIAPSTSGYSTVYFGDSSDSKIGWIEYQHSADTLTIGTNNATVIDIQSDGDLKLNTGNLIIGTSGKGIDFSAVSDGTRSVGENVLSDYEEGTWTPTVTGSSGTPTLNWNNRSGKYTKVGNLVTLSFYFHLNSLTGGSGNFLIKGLPYTINISGNGSFLGASQLYFVSATSQSDPALLNYSTTSFGFLCSSGTDGSTGNNSWSWLPLGAINGSALQGTVTYTT